MTAYVFQKYCRATVEGVVGLVIEPPGRRGVGDDAEEPEKLTMDRSDVDMMQGRKAQVTPHRHGLALY